MTRTLLLVATDEAGTVLEERALRMPGEVAPRQAIGIRCRGDRLTIAESVGGGRREYVYRWTGKELVRAKR